MMSVNQRPNPKLSKAQYRGMPSLPAETIAQPGRSARVVRGVA
jgi:hypothetical protein